MRCQELPDQNFNLIRHSVPLLMSSSTEVCIHAYHTKEMARLASFIWTFMQNIQIPDYWRALIFLFVLEKTDKLLVWPLTSKINMNQNFYELWVSQYLTTKIVSPSTTTHMPVHSCKRISILRVILQDKTTVQGILVIDNWTNSSTTWRPTAISRSSARN